MTLKERLLARERERAAAEAAAKAATEAKTDEAAKAPEEPATEVSTTNETVVGLEDFPEKQQGYILSAYDDAVNRALETITFKETYERLSKGVYERGHEGRTGEGVKILCPNPGHPDKTPSAWIKTTEGKGGIGFCSWKCGTDKGGFDKFDVAAWAYGYSVPSYKHTRAFYEVNCRMALELRGIRKEDFEPRLEPLVIEPEPESKSEKEEKEEEETPSEWIQPPLPIESESLDEDRVPLSLTYDWRAILQISPAHHDGKETFLSEYCTETAKDTTPEEFNLFNGLLAVGLVAGNNITSDDVKSLSANFGMCFVADSGSGKSRSTEHMVSMLRRVIPDSPVGTGVQIRSTVFSGQAMVSALDYRVTDPTKPKDAPGIPIPIRALFEYPELSEIAGGAGIQGSVLKSKIQEVMDHKPHIAYESLGRGVMGAENAFASIVTTTQPKRLKDLLSKDDAAAGFMNRFLFLMGNSKRQLARGKIPLDFSRANSQLSGLVVYANRERNMPWDDDADEYLDKLFQTVVEPYKKNDNQDILTRLDLNLKRMILAFAVNEHAESIAVHHVQMAEALIPYIVKCYERVMGALLNTENREISEWLLQKIKALEIMNINKAKKDKKEIPANPGPSQAELRRYYTKKKGWEDWRVTRSLKELIDAGLVHMSEVKGARGAAAKRYQIISQND